MIKRRVILVLAAALIFALVLPTAIAAPKENAQTVTANLYLPGEYNKKLPGFTAYLNSPKNPLEGSGMPTKPLSKNAELKVSSNGKMILTLKLLNPVFTLQKLGSAKNAKVLSHKMSEDVKEIGSVKHTSRISEIEVELLDKSGEYIFENSTVFPTLLKSDIENVPLHLNVVFNKEEVKETQKAESESIKNPAVNSEIKETKEAVTEESETVEEETENAEEIFESTLETAPTERAEQPAEENPKEESSNKTMIIVVASAVVVALICAGAFIVIKKKKA